MIDSIEAIVGKTPAAVNPKVIDHLDSGALSWIEASPLMFAGFGGAGAIALALGGGPAGFAGGDKRELRFPLDMLDEPELAQAGARFPRC